MLCCVPHLQESCKYVKLAAKCWDVEQSLPALAKLCRGYCKHSYVPARGGGGYWRQTVGRCSHVTVSAACLRFYRGVVWAALTAAYYIANGDVETFPQAALTYVGEAAAAYGDRTACQGSARLLCA